MKTTKRTVILLILVLLATGTTQSTEKPATEISGTRTASCLVKVTADPAILPLNFETIDYLLRSSGVGGKAAREILNVSPDQVYDFFTIEYVDLHVSEVGGGVGIPPRDFRRGPSEQDKTKTSDLEDPVGDAYNVMMYDEMMSTLQPGAEQSQSRDSTRQRGLSSLGRSTSDGLYGSSSSRRTRTATRSPSSTSSSYSRRSSRDRGISYDPYFSPTGPQRSTGTAVGTSVSVSEYTYLFNLNVRLPEEVKPAAKEFMNALIDNLRQTLTDAYHAYGKELQNLLRFAESQRDQAQLQLSEAMKQIKATGPSMPIKQNPADASVHEQLEQIVDLSMLSVEMSFAEVIGELKNSVDPPLQIQPNWKNLLENGEVEPATPAGMEPLTGIKLRKALEILLDGISSNFAELKYVVDEGVILIATEDALPSKMVPRVYEIPALAHSPGAAKDLIDTIQNTIEPDSWFDLGDIGEGTITPYPSQQPRKLAILQTYEIHQEIQEFLESIKMDIPAGTPLEVPEEVLLSEKNNLLAEKQNLEMELARLQGRMPAVEEQIRRMKSEIDEKVQNDQVSEELRSILALQVKYLEEVKKLVESGAVSASGLAEAEEKLARAKIELARRREQIGVSAGTDQLAKFTNEMAMITIDMAEKNSMLGIVNNQLNRIEQQLTASTMLDPQTSRIRLATRALEIAERRVNEINSRLVSVQPPTISMLGGR